VGLVLDSSVTIAWIYNEETTPPVLEVLDRIIASGAWVPALWRMEVANVLEMKVRRRRINAEFRDEALADLSLLPITIDAETDQHVWSATLQLAVRHQLTVYDAVYLELAVRRGLPLATLDRELRAAAQAEGVTLLGV
jgi:predicted nucleic acid-binding protein